MPYRYFYATDGRLLFPEGAPGQKLDSPHQVYAHASKLARRVMASAKDRSDWTSWAVVVMDGFASIVAVQPFPGTGDIQVGRDRRDQRRSEGAQAWH